MGDLISRKALIDDIKKYVVGTPLQEMFETIIDKQPTAYDMDKVAEQLEKQSYKIQNNASHFKNVVNLNIAVSIVKGGGIDE